MATSQHVHAQPTSGSGKGTISVTVDAHTGRVQRSGTLTVSTVTGIKATANCTITQAAAAQVINLTSPTAGTKVEIAASASDRTVTIKGTANCANLAWNILSEGAVITPPAASTVTARINTTDGTGGTSINNNVSIPGDPGAKSLYNFWMKYDLTSYKPGIDTTLEFEVSNGGSIKKTFQIIVKASAGTISLNPTTLTFPASGGNAQTVTVTSNDKWTVS
nr:MAG TPA: lipocalin-like protein [Crassvirales sp.]